ncbi:hypothetical protein AB0756_27100 [Tolypothrix campylonemoides VB511288_2]|uniref:CopG family transcriptional regulator n=1 Tax=Tolypothrix campylonemoides VB511288_2 TaxID=3232311 RepID=A0ABW8XHM3_9CYAN
MPETLQTTNVIIYYNNSQLRELKNISMAKSESAKLWQKAHKEKVKQYNKNYRKNKTTLSVVLDDWVIEQIQQEKDPTQPCGAWVRELVEAWAKNRLQS